MKSSEEFLEAIINNFDKITKKPETFISCQNDHSNEIQTQLKDAYDFSKNEESKTKPTNTLPELIIENFDLEQIWQQLELQNDQFLIESLNCVSKYIVSKDCLLFTEVNRNVETDLADGYSSSMEVNNDLDGNVEPNRADEYSNNVEVNNDTDGDESDKISYDDDADDLSLASDDTSTNNKNSEKKQGERRTKSSIVDDEFFKLSEMETFLNSEEKNLSSENKDVDSGNDTESDEDDQSIDLFKPDSDSDLVTEDARSKNPRYDDFFGDPNTEMKKTRNKFMEEQDETESRELKSTLELREERIKSKIENIEQAALSEKPWQLKGEITAENRPQNSLLEEIVEFDLSSRPAPVITEQTTFQLEDIIRQRIKDRVFDSVERKQKPKETPLEYKKKLVLNQEKSKESLAQIYEKDFLQQQEALNPDANDKDEEDPELHKEIKTMMHKLFTKLDALSNFHFTPKQAAPELRIISNLPAINMEEVAPVVASDAVLLAPEEVKSKAKGDIIGKGERTDTDKKRERRKKKLKQRQHATERKKREELINKIRPGLGNKYSKEKAKQMLEKLAKDKNVDKMDESSGKKGVKSSTAFFTQLQENVKSHIKNKSQLEKSDKKNILHAKKMKL